MSIFGKLDAETVKSNPFHVDAGDYLGEITDADYKTNSDGERRLFIEYTITNDESSFKGSKVKEYLRLPPEDFTMEQFTMLPPDDQKKIREQMAKVKARLCGYSERNRGLGVDSSDLNDPAWSPKALMGIQVRFGVTNGTDGSYVNVKYVALQD